MTDPAKFRQDDLRRVWGDMPLCVITLRHDVVDMQHILGRGYVNGVGTKHLDRSTFSSVFNSVPITREIHAGPLRDTDEMRMLFLRVSRQHVFNAIALDSYILNDNDKAFLVFADEWLASSNPFPLSNGKPDAANED